MFCSGESDSRSNTGRALLDAGTLSRLEPTIERELKARISRGGLSPGQSPLNLAVLSHLLAQLIEERCSPEDQRRYLLFVAPIARRVCLAHIASSSGNAAQLPDLTQIERWLSRLESFDPPSALMIDLRYFAGLTARETAFVMGVTVETVIRDVRFAKAWLAAYLGRPL